MDTKIRDGWCRELRLKTRKQCRGKLNDGEAMCCLGVLADIEMDADWVLVRHADEDGVTATYAIDLSSTTLPSALRERCGITTDEQNDLIHMNDSEKLTFPAIADWIEANL